MLNEGVGGGGGGGGGGVTFSVTLVSSPKITHPVRVIDANNKTSMSDFMQECSKIHYKNITEPSMTNDKGSSF
jgi:hypothetical protein